MVNNNVPYTFIIQLLAYHSIIHLNFAMQLNIINMLRTICLLAAFFCLAFLCSCQKDTLSENPPVTDTTPASQGYMPLTAGTYWVYKDSATSGYDTATVLNETLVQNNITFTKVHLVSSTEDTVSYYGVKDHNYYLYGEQSGVTLTMLVLNDTASVGSSWVYDMGTINGLPARGTGTVVEKLNTYTVQGETFSDVIHSQYVIAFNLLGTFTDFATYDFYFAKGKGIIKIKADIMDITGAGNNETAVQDLVDYSIK